jgi:hypothetical protein
MLKTRLENIIRFCQKHKIPVKTTSWSHLEVNPEKGEYYFLTHHTTGRRFVILDASGEVILPSGLDDKESQLFENNIKSLENVMTTRRHPGPYLDDEYPDFKYEVGP